MQNIEICNLISIYKFRYTRLKFWFQVWFLKFIALFIKVYRLICLKRSREFSKRIKYSGFDSLRSSKIYGANDASYIPGIIKNKD